MPVPHEIVEAAYKGNLNKLQAWLDGGGTACAWDREVLEVACGNLMHIDDIQEADIVMLETEVSPEVFGQFSGMLNRAKEGSRLLTYLDLRKVWQLSGSFPFRQLEANRSFADRYPTSWSVQRGHHFFLWIKLLKPPLGSALSAAGGSQSAGASDGFADAGFPARCPLPFCSPRD